MVKPDVLRDMLGREELTSAAKARTILLSSLINRSLQTETVDLPDALGRVTAEDIIAPEDLPPCDRSTMDGYAVISSDTYGASQSLPGYLNITGEVLMGTPPTGAVSRGSCFKIPTGGLMPQGADAVLMFEHTVPVDETMIEIVKDIGTGSNVIKKGDDITKATIALQKNSRIRPQDLGLLAGLGISCVRVFKKVTVGIISTGDEIIDYREPLHLGKIRNINSITLGGFARQNGAEIKDYGIVSDTEAHFFPTVEKAVSETDIVLFSGGSSVGMRDIGEQAISRLGAPGVLVHGVALKPGKPVIIGMCSSTPIFGLPGHPVSAAVCFDMFVKPAIIMLSGQQKRDNALVPFVSAILQRSINSAAGRLDIIRVQLEAINDEIHAIPVLGRSGAISSLSRAHGFFEISEDSQGLQKGTPVKVLLYQ